MATEVNLPELGESVTEGTVTRWLKQVGDSVTVDEPLLEVSTDKVDTEIPSPVAGTLLEIKANEDDTVEVGGPLAVIGSADEQAGGGAADTGGGDQGAMAEQPEQPEQPEQQAEPPLAQEAEEQESAGASVDESDMPAGQAPPEEPARQPEPAAGAASGGEQTMVRLPELGESVTEGTVTRWLKQVGDQVTTDEPLLEVSTDKVDTEIPSPAAGTLLEIKVDEDETVEVGAELAVIGSGDAAGGAPTPAPEQPAEAPAAEQPESPAEPEPAPEPEQAAAPAAA
ncbi:MAG: 2-oxoglutarate dehydrogenase, E2 component, dihydrolipoamide succinyltransferase, partial [Nocardioides sp.]|nr:2-oxoglutarate dehydrogenase, E2 component, dihydrolipoamide succinyltransferase [Nocardioides sp.]